MKKLIYGWAVFFAVILATVGSTEEFSAMVYISDREQNFQGFDPKNIVIEYAYGETVYSAVLANGFARGTDNKVDLSADIQVIDPAGNMILEEKDFAVLKDEVPDGTGAVILDKVMDLTAREDDPLGIYTITANVRDLISGATDTVEAAYLLFDTQRSKELISAPVRSAKGLDDLWGEYFRSKNPLAVRRVISALQLLENTKDIKDAAVGGAAKWSLTANAKAHPDVLNICREVLEDNREFAQDALYRSLQEIVADAGQDKGI